MTYFPDMHAYDVGTVQCTSGHWLLTFRGCPRELMTSAKLKNLDENKHFHIDIEVVISFTKKQCFSQKKCRNTGQKQPDAAQLLTDQVTEHLETAEHMIKPSDTAEHMTENVTEGPDTAEHMPEKAT